MFDRAAFESLTAGNVDVARSLTDLFREDVHDLIEQLETAIAEGDEEVARRIGHTMKSSCGSVGATTASALGARIESEGLVIAATILGDLNEAVESALEQLESCANPAKT